MYSLIEKIFRFRAAVWTIIVTLGMILMLMGLWQGALIVGIFSLFFFWTWYDTGYKITETTLIIRNGPFHKNIPLEKVISIKAVKRNKLKIRYGEQEAVIVALSDREKCIDLMKNSCPLLGIEAHEK